MWLNGLVNLEKTFDTVTRKMVMATVRWMGVAEASMVEAMHERTKGSSGWTWAVK